MADNKYTTEELENLSETELQERLDDDKKHLGKLRFNHSISLVENPGQLKAVKRDIARLKTEIRARQIGHK